MERLAIFNVLIVEDDPDKLAALKRAFSLNAALRKRKRKEGNQQVNFALKLFEASSLSEAKEMIKTTLFHGISLDQRILNRPGGDASSKFGEELVEYLSALSLPLIAAIYTAYPNNGAAQRAGAWDNINYIEKSTKTDGNHKMTTNDYAAWFVETLQANYILKVLKRAGETGFPNISVKSNAARIYLTKALQRGQNSDFNNFFSQMTGIKDELNMILLAYAIAIIKHFGLDEIRDDGNRSASGIEKKLEEYWREIEKKNLFDRINLYLNVKPSNSLSDHYLVSTKALRERRNELQHPTYKEYTIIDYFDYFADLVRLSEMLSFMANSSIMYQPYLEIDGTLQFTEVNIPHPEKKCIKFSSDQLPIFELNEIYFKFTGHNLIVPLSGGYKVIIDDNSIPRLRRIV